MNDRRESIAIIASCTAVLATVFLAASAHIPRPTARIIHRTFDDLIEGNADPEYVFPFSPMELLPDADNWSDDLVPPAVESAAEISQVDKVEILNLVIADVLQNPDFQDSRDFYGTPGSRSAVVIPTSDVQMPLGFKPTVPGWRIEQRDGNDQSDPDSERVVAIRFDKFAPHESARFLFDGHVAVCIYNGGGNPDGSLVIGGCFAFYCVDRSNGKWTVTCVFAKDP